MKARIVALGSIALLIAIPLLALSQGFEGRPGPPSGPPAGGPPGSPGFQGPPPGPGSYGRAMHGPPRPDESGLPFSEMGPGRGLHDMPLEAIQRMLGITDEQMKQMRTGLANFREQTRKARMTLLSLMDEKKTMLLSGKVNQEKLAKIDEEIVKVQAEVMRERLKLQRERLALLTEDQITKIADYLARREHQSMLGRMFGKAGRGRSE